MIKGNFNLKIIGVFSFFLILIPSEVVFSFTGHHTKIPGVVDVVSVSMGNTGSVNSEGSSAIFHNPAFMCEVEVPEINVGGRFYFGFQESSYYYDYSWIYPLPNLTCVSCIYPIEVSALEILIVPGIGYHAPIDYSYKLKYDFEFGSDWTESGSYLTKGSFNTISPALAVGFFDRF